ncbi:hypothetical protein ACWDUN_25075 [Mycobacterium sp. NPDC003323]
MAENVAVSRARLLLAALDEQVAVTSRELEAIDDRDAGAGALGRPPDSRVRALRRDRYEAHRLIDGIYCRFPELRQSTRS